MEQQQQRIRFPYYRPDERSAKEDFVNSAMVAGFAAVLTAAGLSGK